MFSIGTHFKKKKVKVKTRVKRKSIYNYRYQTDRPFEFNIYSGKRWKIPNCIPVSESIKHKFSSLECVFSFRDIKHMIHENIRSMKFKFSPVISANQWKPPPNISSSITSYYAKQENEWNKVRAIYYRLFKFREAVKPLIFRWQIKKCLKNRKNIEDPVTMELPKKPVTIIDFEKRMSFTYDARTLIKTIENRLLLSDYMFPDPREPVNLLTNEAFTYGQLISLWNQCKQYGEASWMLDSLKESHGIIAIFSAYNKQRLKIEAIKTFFKKPTYIIRESVIDYFNVEADYAEMPNYQMSRFINAFDLTPERAIIQEWIGITRDYYITKELNDPSLLASLAIKSDNFLNAVSRIFQI